MVQPLGLPDKFALLIGATAIVFYNLETKVCTRPPKQK
jgi:hypothetical protein